VPSLGSGHEHVRAARGRGEDHRAVADKRLAGAKLVLLEIEVRDVRVGAAVEELGLEDGRRIDLDPEALVEAVADRLAGTPEAEVAAEGVEVGERPGEGVGRVGAVDEGDLEVAGAVALDPQLVCDAVGGGEAHVGVAPSVWAFDAQRGAAVAGVEHHVVLADDQPHVVVAVAIARADLGDDGVLALEARAQDLLAVVPAAADHLELAADDRHLAVGETRGVHGARADAGVRVEALGRAANGQVVVEADADRLARPPQCDVAADRAGVEPRPRVGVGRVRAVGEGHREVTRAVGSHLEGVQDAVGWGEAHVGVAESAGAFDAERGAAVAGVEHDVVLADPQADVVAAAAVVGAHERRDGRGPADAGSDEHLVVVVRPVAQHQCAVRHHGRAVHGELPAEAGVGHERREGLVGRRPREVLHVHHGAGHRRNGRQHDQRRSHRMPESASQHRLSSGS